MDGLTFMIEMDTREMYAYVALILCAGFLACVEDALHMPSSKSEEQEGGEAYEVLVLCFD